jgi:hypothetical protein
MTTLWRVLLPGLLAAANSFALAPTNSELIPEARAVLEQTYPHDHLITLDELPKWKR